MKDGHMDYQTRKQQLDQLNAEYEARGREPDNFLIEDFPYYTIGWTQDWAFETLNGMLYFRHSFPISSNPGGSKELPIMVTPRNIIIAPPNPVLRSGGGTSTKLPLVTLVTTLPLCFWPVFKLLP